MSEERKVFCKCGKEMHFGCAERDCLCGEAPWGGMYTCRCGWLSPYREGDTPEDCERNAYLAATATPPNRPLTRDQVETMPRLTALYHPYDDGMDGSLAIMTAAIVCDMPISRFERGLYFATLPTQADIAAAREAGKGEGNAPATNIP